MGNRFYLDAFLIHQRPLRSSVGLSNIRRAFLPLLLRSVINSIVDIRLSQEKHPCQREGRERAPEDDEMIEVVTIHRGINTCRAAQLDNVALRHAPNRSLLEGRNWGDILVMDIPTAGAGRRSGYKSICSQQHYTR